MTALSKDKSINIAIIAMGGQGGGVLSKWILDLAEDHGFLAQYTSVPGVAQRTGATIYYIELFSAHLAEKAGKSPVLALTPIPGDVDIVIASEMMEAGRALAKGFVTDKTTMVASNHRDYAIIEKQIMGDGRRDLKEILTLCEKNSARFIYFDMDAAAREAGTVISSVLFGAVAGSEALPFNKEGFIQTIKNTKKVVEANIRGFEYGYARAQGTLDAMNAERKTQRPAAPAVQPLLDRIKNEFPGQAHFMIREGLKKCVDYQDVKYAHSYMDRLAEFKTLDENLAGPRRDWRLTKDMARYLALAMCYEDTSRVADLKTRATRFERFRDDVKATPGQIVNVSEYMHPRLEEICDILPARLGGFILKSKLMHRIINPFIGEGRRVTTTKLPGYLLLHFIAGFRKRRRGSYRFKKENSRIYSWMDEVKAATQIDYDLGCEVAGLQRLIKGYGDTRERGLHNSALIMNAYHDFKIEKGASLNLKTLKEAALKDEEGVALRLALDKIHTKVLAI